MFRFWRFLTCLVAGLTLIAGAGWTQQAQTSGKSATLETLRRGFASPPEDARPMMRWWWFGPAVNHDELARELRTMQDGGIGGVEIQPVYPLALDDPQTGFRNLCFLSPEFLRMVSFAAKTGESLGMRVSITLGSGWPYGGAWVPVTESSSDLRVAMTLAQKGEESVAVPALENGEQMLGAFLAEGTPDHYDAEHAQELEVSSQQSAAGGGGRLHLPAGLAGDHVVLFFISSRTGQQVKRPAAGAEGFVIDHFSARAVQDHLKNVAAPLVAAFADRPPYSVFSDSLEVYGADWTPDFLAQFRNRRGYDLTPYLPELAGGTDERAADLRYDWARTLAELIDQNYLAAINAWARAHHTEFRAQNYGVPAVTLSSNARVDLPEGEGSQWHGPFSYTRWATSASHLYGRSITSSETWTWLHSPPFRATPLDMKAEADTFFLQGINQLMGHGWPYSPPSAGDPGWSFYAAAVFNNHNPWWMVMPDVMRYMARMSWLLRQGKPANDVAVLLPEEDAQARFRPALPGARAERLQPGQSSVSDRMAELLGPDLVSAILDAGYNFDFIDSEAIDRVGIQYPILVLPETERLPLAAYRKIEAYARDGGIVIAVGHAPQRAPGLLESERDRPAVQQISHDLFIAGTKNTRLLHDASDLGAALHSFLQPNVALSPATPEVGFIHRKLPDADIWFLANTGNQPHGFTATFRTHRRDAEWWDPFTGTIMRAGSGPSLAMSLAPYESRVVVFSDHAAQEQRRPAAPEFAPIDLSHDWNVTLDKTGATETMQTLHSWADDPPCKYYSGTATYTRTVQISPAVEQAGDAALDFGQGQPVPRAVLHLPGMRTWYDAPVRDAALVYVNGRLAGSVWRPPYTLDIGSLLHAGTNGLKIVVANTAINELAGRSAPDYRLLWMRYGKRFAPQDQDHLEPLPSGLLGPLRIVPAQDNP